MLNMSVLFRKGCYYVSRFQLLHFTLIGLLSSYRMHLPTQLKCFFLDELISKTTQKAEESEIS